MVCSLHVINGISKFYSDEFKKMNRKKIRTNNEGFVTHVSEELIDQTVYAYVQDDRLGMLVEIKVWVDFYKNEWWFQSIGNNRKKLCQRIYPDKDNAIKEPFFKLEKDNALIKKELNRKIRKLNAQLKECEELLDEYTK